MTLVQTTRAIQNIVRAKPDGIYGPATAAAVLAALRGRQAQAPGTVALPPADHDPLFDARTEKALATLQPGAQRKFRPFVRRAIAIGASMGVDVKVICGYRNKADQEEAKRSGASKAAWGYGWHNYGMAIDFGLFRGPSYVDKSNPALAFRTYSAIGAICGDYGIDWGGNWKSFRDNPHFQIAGPSTPSAADRRALADGTFHY